MIRECIAALYHVPFYYFLSYVTSWKKLRQRQFFFTIKKWHYTWAIPLQKFQSNFQNVSRLGKRSRFFSAWQFNFLFFFLKKIKDWDTKEFNRDCVIFENCFSYIGTTHVWNARFRVTRKMKRTKREFFLSYYYFFSNSGVSYFYFFFSYLTRWLSRRKKNSIYSGRNERSSCAGVLFNFILQNIKGTCGTCNSFPGRNKW